MKSIGLLFCLLIILLVVGKNDAQTLVCNDMTTLSLNNECTHTLTPENILEGTILDNCVVELDKIPPFGNGPWVAGVLGPDDVGNTYQARVRHVPSGNSCWGNIQVQDKLPPVLHCNSLSTVNLNAGSAVIIPTTDLNISATDGCGSVTLSPATLQYDCINLGVSVVQLLATDESGNTATCKHTILVANSTNCQACVGTCPESVIVSYNQGHSTLLPAYQNGDLSVFDQFGNALLDVGCVSFDSTYAVTYQAGTGGQNWFTRQWNWVEGTSGFISCKQSIIFSATQTVVVQGKVYLDTSEDCISDAGEPGVNHFPLVITKLPSGTTQNIHIAADGTYSADIVFTPQDTAAQLHLILSNGVTSVCPSALIIPNSSNTGPYTFDIGLHAEGDCPLMQVDIGALNSRRCAVNSLLVQYCNVGLDTAYGAYVTVHLDPLLSLQSATWPYTVDTSANTYTFAVGDVTPFYCGSFSIKAFLSCDAGLGQTLCNEAFAYPNTPCNGPWLGVQVDATADCVGDSVSLAIWNRGPEDMTTALDFIVIEDFIMYQDGSFQLDAGDSITIKVPANGATWRIEAQQTPDFPVVGVAAAAVEGCNGLNTPGLINAFYQDDNALYYDMECVVITGSYDPNDKTAVPAGYDNEHFIRANEAIEYKIRFQNTGTDTAFRVVVVDTLSALLDPLSLEAGVASHPYRLDVYPGGILHFVFQPIALPDSNANEEASHGFVQFRIAQRPDLPAGTVLENTAAIYFDQNAPVITNTAFQTIGYPFVTVDSWAPYLPGVRVLLAPNPFREQAVLTVEGKRFSAGRVLLYDAQGRLLRSQEMTDNRVILQRGDLPGGLYFFQIMEQGACIAGGKLQVN